MEGKLEPQGLNKVLYCPYADCKKPILNTARFMHITRELKFIRDDALRKKRKLTKKAIALGYKEAQKRQLPSSDSRTSPPAKRQHSYPIFGAHGNHVSSYSPMGGGKRSSTFDRDLPSNRYHKSGPQYLNPKLQGYSSYRPSIQSQTVSPALESSSTSGTQSSRAGKSPVMTRTGITNHPWLLQWNS